MKHSTKRTNLLFLYLVLAVMAAGILWMVEASVETVESAPRRTATPSAPACRPGVEGKEYCADRFQTSVARPNEKNVPRKETPTPKRGK